MTQFQAVFDGELRNGEISGEISRQGMVTPLLLTQVSLGLRATPTATPRPVPTPAATSLPSLCPIGAPAATTPASAQPTPPAPSANQTRILVDGKVDDWAGRPVLFDDPAGDVEELAPDLGTGRAFVNRHALYILVEARGTAVDPETLFQIDVQADARRLRLLVAPRRTQGFLADITTGFRGLGNMPNSAFAFGPALEGRVDLRDLGSPESISLIDVQVLVGECYPQRTADQSTPSVATPVVAEVDPAWRLAPRGGARELERTLAAPDTRAITLAYDPDTRRVRVTGASGAVPEGTKLLVGNLELNDLTTLNADARGAFETEVVGAPGSHVLIKQDVTGQIIRTIETTDENNIAPGVLLRVPVPAAAGEGIPFAAAARLCCQNQGSATWAIEGTFEREALQPGDLVRISGRFSLLSDPSTRPPDAHLQFRANLLADAQGRQVGRAGKFVTPFLTATGLPIERTLFGPPVGSAFLAGLTLTSWQFDGARWVAEYATTLRVPANARTGLYTLTAEAFELREMKPAGTRPFSVTLRDKAANQATLGTFTIGNPAPMRLSATLLADDVSEGSHGGVLAREDRGLFDISGRALTRHQPVIPRLDGYGEPWSYRLDPYAPMIDVVDRLPAHQPGHRP